MSIRQLRVTFCLALVTFVVFTPISRLSADTYTVTSTADLADPTPLDGICDGCTLRAAIQTANAHAGPDEIILPAGLFRLTQTGAGEDVCLSGDLDITATDALTITGAGRDTTIIDGLTTDRVLHVLAGPPLIIQDLTIRNGAWGSNPGGGLLYIGPGALTILRARFTDNLADVGGAIGAVTVTGLTITDCIFEGNRTTGLAGAIAVGTTSGPAQFSRSQFIANHAWGAGGSLNVGGTGTTTISYCSFDGCQSQSAGGAAMIGTTGGLTLTESDFTFNIANGNGGAVCFQPAPPAGNCTITNCEFVTNACTGGGDGGAVCVLTTDNLAVAGCRFDSNYADSAGGGLAGFAGSNISVLDTEFSSNVSMNNVGGGLALATSAALTLSGLLVTDNDAHDGGGGLSVNGFATASITACTFSGNRARELPGGGGAVVAGTGPLVMADCTFFQNTVTSGRFGGGLATNATITGMTMTGCAFIENQAIEGGSCGGLYYQSSGPGTIANCTFSGNLATDGGGAVGQGGAGDLTITNCTLTDNGATGAMGGGAILRGAVVGGVILRNSIIADSFAGANCAGGTTSQGGNIDSDASCIFPLIPGADLVNTDPLLAPLANNGGPTLSHALLTGSPAIDAAHPANCPAADQRGQTRPLDGNHDGATVCDIGAFEYSDCNSNNQDDMSEIAGGAITDCNHNGVPDNCDSPDTDGDGIWDVCDPCTDTDGDGFGNPGFPASTCALDLCPVDPNKQAPGLCGCGTADADGDGDGVSNCLDQCPTDPNKQLPGLCGCGAADADSDGDLIPDCLDNCPDTPNADQADANGDGVGDACTPPPETQPAPCGCSAGLPLTVPFMLLGFAWMKRRRTRTQVLNGAIPLP